MTPAKAIQLSEWLEGHRVNLAAPVTRADIVGIGHVMDELNSLIGRLRNPDVMASLGADLPRGVLLFGAPGTGKTLAARYLAASLGKDVPIFQLSADELSAERVRTLFAELQALGRRSVLYLDEIDLVALHRSDAEHDAVTRATLIALLAALDGVTSSSGPLLVAASNREPVFLDPALMRSGRIGVRIAFNLPNEDERAKLFALFLGQRPTSEVDINRLAKVSEGRTPADIRALVDDATGLALAQDRQVTTQADLLAALRRDGDIEPERGPEPIDWDWLRRAARHEAGHVAVAVALRGADSVDAVSLHRNGGHTAVGPQNASADVLRDQLAIGHGGLAAEQLFYSAPVLSALMDVRHATQIAWQLANCGLLAGVTPVDYEVEFRQTHASWSEQAARVVHRTLATSRRRAERIVGRQRDAIERFAGVLTADFIDREHGEPEDRFEPLTGSRLRDAITAAGFVRDAQATRSGPCADTAGADTDLRHRAAQRQARESEPEAVAGESVATQLTSRNGNHLAEG